jgi:hypothetical protein
VSDSASADFDAVHAAAAAGLRPEHGRDFQRQVKLLIAEFNSFGNRAELLHVGCGWARGCGARWSAVEA